MVKAELAKPRPVEARPRQLERLRELLGSVQAAWQAAIQEQRNRLAKALYTEIWVENQLHPPSRAGED